VARFVAPVPAAAAAGFIREPAITPLSLQGFGKVGKRQAPRPSLDGAFLQTVDRQEFLPPTLRMRVVPTPDARR